MTNKEIVRAKLREIENEAQHFSWWDEDRFVVKRGITIQALYQGMISGMIDSCGHTAVNISYVPWKGLAEWAVQTAKTADIAISVGGTDRAWFGNIHDWLREAERLRVALAAYRHAWTNGREKPNMTDYHAVENKGADNA